MRELKVLGVFTLRFALVFTLLIFPWPPLKHFFHAIFRGETRLLINLTFPRKTAQVEPYDDPQHSSIDTKVTVGDLHTSQLDGQAPVKGTTLDARSLAWIPHAVWFALCAATPMSSLRKAKMLLTGLILVQFFVAVTVYNAILAAFIDVSAPHWQSLLLEISSHLLIDNLWVSFVVPLLFWCIWLGWQDDWRTILRCENVRR